MELARKRACLTENVDRISELPEELKIRILSLLEMNDAVKTGILSKNWKNLWIHCNNLVFKFHYPRGSVQSLEANNLQLQKFISFVDHSLMQCNCPTLNKVKLSSRSVHYCENSLHASVDKWVEYVLKRNVEFLSLKNIGLNYSAPYCMYQSSSLLHLKLQWLEISKSSSRVSLTSLKHLSLKYLHGKDKSIENILLGCPVLETLVLENVLGLNHLNIMSRKVRKLSLRSINLMTSRGSLKIKAPWLQELEISKTFLVSEFQLIDVSSLKNATLLFNFFGSTMENTLDDMLIASHLKWSEMVNGVLNSLCNVGELSIGSEIIQVLSLLKLSGQPQSPFMCKHVKINSCLWKYDLPGIVYLLEITPYLETLIIEVSSWQEKVFPLHHTKELFSDRDPHMSLPNGNFKHLKNVKFDYVKSSCCQIHEDRVDFELLKYTLRSAVDLEKLTICSSKSHNGKYFNYCKSQYASVLSSKLSTFMTESESSKWEVKEKSSYEFIFSNPSLLG